MEDAIITDADTEPDADTEGEARSAMPILQQYRDRKIKFSELVEQLAAFPWRRPTPSDDVWGVLDDWMPLADEPGTMEEIDEASALGWLTPKESRAINAALYKGPSADAAAKDEPPEPSEDEPAEA